MKLTTVYERGGKLYVHSVSKTTDGVWMMSAPVLAVSKENVEEIGESIRECLEASRQGVPHPTSWTNQFRPVLDLVGVKSHGTFMKGTKCVQVEMIDEAVTLTPMRNDGPRDGFSYLSNKMQIALGSDEALGKAALAALALAT